MVIGTAGMWTAIVELSRHKGAEPDALRLL
ncbi:hypothetical protein HD597_007369 [Nonomuraea thailandensis]|uniref:Uncharacterized protein n=1 Tax=Nonomuraea thailandensis TaxID=1188745 RepID=A0A9X2GMJ8_9ACTN|nr:hypothetical protein [Nonomuraea thailandensis]